MKQLTQKEKSLSAAYKAFFEAQSPKVKASMIAAGTHLPVFDSQHGGREQDADAQEQIARAQEGTTPAANFPMLIDTLTDNLRDAVANGKPLRDVSLALVSEARRQASGEILLRLLDILGNSKNVRLDIEVLISSAGLGLRDCSDSSIAKSLNVSRAVFSARKIVLMDKLQITPPAHSKSLAAREVYKLTNRSNHKA